MAILAATVVHHLAHMRGLVNHNVDFHGAAVGAQLRQSEEIQKQRREE